MGQELLHESRVTGHSNSAALIRGIAWGLIGGLVGTIVMDFVLIVALSAVGLPAVISFSTIGDTAAGFFALLGIPLAGGFPLGANLVRYLNGLKLRGFNTVLGVAAIAAGVGFFLGIDLSFLAILLILWGALILFREFTGKRESGERAE